MLRISKQFNALDHSVALIPRVFAEGRENLPRLLQRIESPDFNDAPRIVGIDGEGHRFCYRSNSAKSLWHLESTEDKQIILCRTEDQGRSYNAAIGGKDTLIASSMNINSIAFLRINQRDIFVTDGNTSVLLLDPQGIEGQANRIENFKIGKKNFSLNKLTNKLSSMNSFIGDFTYQELEFSGYIDFNAYDLNVFQISDYIQAAIHNNSLIS